MHAIYPYFEKKTILHFDQNKSEQKHNIEYIHSFENPLFAIAEMFTVHLVK